MTLTEHFAARTDAHTTTEMEAIPGREADMVRNAAGGMAFAVDDWTMLRRFLLIGTEGGTFYVGENKLTVENARAIVRCLKQDGDRVVNEIVQISHEGRAVKNDFAVFALAMAASFGVRGAMAGDMGDGAEGLVYTTDPGRATRVRKKALAALPRVCRTGTHLYQFVNDVQQFRGWGRTLRRAVARAWYELKETDTLAYQMLKYAHRNGWRHRDVMRLAHPNPQHMDPAKRAAVTWTLQRDAGERPASSDLVDHRMRAVNDLADAGCAYETEIRETRERREYVQKAADLIRSHALPREVVPSTLMNEPAIWDALLETMPMTAMLRSLNRMTQVGLIDETSEATDYVVRTLADENALKKARIHPVQILVALRTYASGSGRLGAKTWTPARKVTDALDAAFYKAFATLEPTGKRFLLGLDVSGSMSRPVANGNLSCREAATAMAMSTAAVEPDTRAYAFAHQGRGAPDLRRRGFCPIDVSPRRRLDDIVTATSRLPFGATDCALPVKHAIENEIPVDCFVVYTDNENWAGDEHAAQALRRYRDHMGIDARMIAVAMAATNYSVADPHDRGMMDVVGFDANLPRIVGDFAQGAL